MKKSFLILALSALTAGPCVAGGVNITWGTSCWSDGGGTANKTFACNTNLGSAQMCGSFMCSTNHPNFVRMHVVEDGQSSSATLPDWWQLWNTGACRQTALGVSVNFTTAPQIGCTDPWMGLGLSGVAAWQTALFPPPYPQNAPAPNASRLLVVAEIPNPVPLAAGVEYYGFHEMISYSRTLGTPSCTGCTVPMTFVLSQIEVVENTGQVEFLTTALANQCLGWQTTNPPCAAVPARGTTWGQVKALYR